jgi:glycosyltransferase involved in cell wall biosynthesis
MSSASSGESTEGRVPVSVVIPCHNAAGTVGRAVDSVLAQSVKPLEIIAVDDASDDDTHARLVRLRDAQPAGFVEVVRMPANRGAASARNAGWGRARAPWVAFLDADDTWHPRKLELQYAALRDHGDADLLAHTHDFSWARWDHEGAGGASVIGRCQLLSRNRFVTPSVMIRRDAARRFQESQRHMEDHLLWMQMACDRKKLVLIHRPLVTLYKPAFGDSGLSGDLWAMQRADLVNYRRLYREGQVGVPTLVLLWSWSCVKFLRRLLILARRRSTTRDN